MKVGGDYFRTIWLCSDGCSVEIIDQTKLPHEFSIVKLSSMKEAIHAIYSMQVRGAPLVGVTGAYGLWLALKKDASDINLKSSYDLLLTTRPTAVNLRWALDRITNLVHGLEISERANAALIEANSIANEDVNNCRAIGENGLLIIDKISKNKDGEIVNILTHCNAGWLATVDYGTALAPIYTAHDSGIGVHVWVDETRPRNQGASLTAWELGQHGIPHTVISDNTGGHLMQKGLVDLCITGTDRTTAVGDVCNKIGTYLKALAAKDNFIPFYVALPYSTIDWTISDGVSEIDIEERDQEEVTHMIGRNNHGKIEKIQLTPDGTSAANFAFDVTPSRLVTGLITERGVCSANREGLLNLYPENRMEE